MKRRNGMNKKLEKIARNMYATDDQLEQFSNLADKYKNKSQREIEEEMYKMIDGFSTAEKKGMIKKLQMLKEMNNLLDNGQMRKIDTFIRILSK
ncbi:hypothetical protein [Marinisporobacter balticus]|uniref:Uncharacterized protein n=1 Tax=Marinisporobacter balticus TaxID=2018667 RepID=A0A4R2KPL2_9FIRM|nr:hypothetical protein [Marinisporobacter balticus]TCO74577.1 hypothetical protein EV214_11256 [Marinisporobacter balticus]